MIGMFLSFCMFCDGPFGNGMFSDGMFSDWVSCMGTLYSNIREDRQLYSIILEGIVKQILQIVLDRIGNYIILERIVKQILQIVLETILLT